MDPRELASAFALASLASFSPGTKEGKPIRITTARQSQESITAIEARSPKSETNPVSPELRSPVRSIKRVHFASSVNEQQQSQGQNPTSRLFNFPPPVSPHSFPIAMQPSAFRGFTIPPQHPQWMQGQVPPQRFMQPQVARGDQHWICDFCNAAAFHTYKEAYIHEATCKLQCKPPNSSEMLASTGIAFRGFRVGDNPGRAFEADTSTFGSSGFPPKASNEKVWYTGSMSLSIPESDVEWLSELNCFIRKNCIEAFSATEEDVTSTSKRGRITLHQVGIRCCQCKHRQLKDRAVAAVSYPTSVAGIYESVKRWQRVHLEHCEDVSAEVKSKITALQDPNVWIPATRQYWADSARTLGMVDTESGIRFSYDPKSLKEITTNERYSENYGCAVAPERNERKVLADGEYIVFPEDMRIVPTYVYFLMRQVESCHFSEVDRFVARSKGPIGYPGFQCRHCSGHAGLGKYFPVSAKTLSTNSTSQNIHAHLLKCRKCPDQIREKLLALKVDKGRSPRLEPGWRKIFFDKVWERLHG